MSYALGHVIDTMASSPRLPDPGATLAATGEEGL